MRRTLFFIALMFVIFLSFGCKKVKTPTVPDAASPAATSTAAAVSSATITPTMTVPAADTVTPTITPTVTQESTLTVTGTITTTQTQVLTETSTVTITVTSTATASATVTETSTAVCSVVIGNASTGSYWGDINYIYASGYVCASDVAVNVLGLVQNNPGLFVIGIYTDATGKPGTLLAQTGIQSENNPAKERSISPVIMTAGTKYWLVAATEEFGLYHTGGSNSLRLAYSWGTISADSGLPADLSSYSWLSNAFVNTIYGISCN